MANELLLSGLDGANSLAFLAALGTFRTLAGENDSVTLHWLRHSNAWRPVLTLDAPLDEMAMTTRLYEALKQRTPRDAFTLGDNPSVPRETFREFAGTAFEAAQIGDRNMADFLAAFAGEAPIGKDGRVPDTALRTMNGSGHQHFLKFMRNFIDLTSHEHLYKALFKLWRYDDPVESMTLRLDPSDDSRYALRWNDPSGDPSRRSIGSMWGANRLAIEALPLFPTLPGSRQLETTGFHTQGARNTYWIWPIWSAPIGLETLRALLSLADLQSAGKTSSLRLQQRGIVEAFRSRRLTNGKFRNFTVGVAVSC